MSADNSIDRRRGVRVNTSFWVQVAGIDRAPVLRNGNISVSGIFIKISQKVGPPGTIYSLKISTNERGPFVEIMTRVVRSISYNDLWEGTVNLGVAFEYLVQNEAVKDSIRNLVIKTAEIQVKKAKDLQLDYSLAVQVQHNGAKEKPALVSNLCIDSLVMDTDWQVDVGEMINVAVEVPESNKKIVFKGKVISSDVITQYDQQRYKTQIEFVENISNIAERDSIGQTFGSTISEAVDGLLSEVIAPRIDQVISEPSKFLRGSLSQVSLSSLLGFFEIERMTGVLNLVWNKTRASLFLYGGRLVRITSDLEESDIKEVLSKLLQWDKGEFEFEDKDVELKESQSHPITQLLLEIAKEQDEDSSEED
jgi:hypothetical protein